MYHEELCLPISPSNEISHVLGVWRWKGPAQHLLTDCQGKGYFTHLLLALG